MNSCDVFTTSPYYVYSTCVRTIKDNLYFSYLEVIKQKGLENITVDDLVAEITPKGRGKHHIMLYKLP